MFLVGQCPCLHKFLSFDKFIIQVTKSMRYEDCANKEWSIQFNLFLILTLHKCNDKIF